MTKSHKTADLKERIRSVERELFELRCRLDGGVKELAQGRIDIMEITVSGTKYAINVGPVREVIPVLRCEPVQESPAWLLGTFQYGKEIVPVVDTGYRLNGETTTLRPSLKIVLVDALHLTGLVVSDVGDIYSFERDQIAAAPCGIPQADYVIGALPGSGDGPVFLLSIDALSREVTAGSRHDG
jgi:chemotaxis signal transduction protein